MKPLNSSPTSPEERADALEEAASAWENSPRFISDDGFDMEWPEEDCVWSPDGGMM